jgi:hypothetical protein
VIATTSQRLAGYLHISKDMNRVNVQQRIGFQRFLLPIDQNQPFRLPRQFAVLFGNIPMHKTSLVNIFNYQRALFYMAE